MVLTGADIFAEVLVEQGVETLFGYPGGAVLNLYDALYKYSGKIRHIMTAHEQGAAHAADGYARATGKTGVFWQRADRVRQTLSRASPRHIWTASPWWRSQATSAPASSGGTAFRRSISRALRCPLQSIISWCARWMSWRTFCGTRSALRRRGARARCWWTSRRM